MKRETTSGRWAFPMGNAGWMMLVVVIGWMGCAPSEREMSVGAQLILSTQTLQPDTTFEIRFEESIVPAERIGSTADPSPLTIQPPVRGTFRWLSTRSGVFQPAQPLALGRTYRFHLQRGLKLPDGRRSRARLIRLVRTPEFGVDLARGPQANQGVLPESILSFNADVDPKRIEPFLEFASTNGERRAVLAERVDLELARPFWTDYRWNGNLTWEVHSNRLRAGQGWEPDTNDPPHNWIHVMPHDPLTPEVPWSLVLKQGLPARQPGLALAQAVRIDMGVPDVFRVRDVTPHNSIENGRRLSLGFTRRVTLTHRYLNDQSWDNWIRIQPSPGPIEWVTYGHVVEARADFDIDTPYTVTVRAGLTSAENETLPKDTTHPVVFQPHPPRLYFPALEDTQLAEGARRYPLRVLNLPRVKVSARLLDRHTLIHALRGYEHYQKQSDGRWDSLEPYQKLPFDLVPGRRIHERTIETRAPVDTALDVPLHWDEILGPQARGVVFLQAEGETIENGKPIRTGTQSVIQVSDLGLYWKLSPGQCVVHVFSLETGRPLEHVAVRLCTEDGEVLEEVQTDAWGLANLTRTGQTEWIMAERGSDLQAVRLSRHGTYVSGRDIDQEWRLDEKGRTPRPKLLLFTDRLTYRPGETVHVKAMARLATETSLALPEDPTATLEIFQPRGDLLLRTNLAWNEFGSCALDVRIPGNVRGRFWVRISAGEGSADATFRAEDLTPEAFSLDWELPDVQEEPLPIRVPLRAHYLMGAPVAQGRVQWSVEAEDTEFAPEAFREFTFNNDIWQDGFRRRPSTYAEQGEGAFTSAEPYLIEANPPVNRVAPHPQRVVVEASLTDLNQQTVTETRTFLQHSTAFYLGMKTLSFGPSGNEPWPLDLIAVGQDGQPWREPVPVTVTLYRLDYEVQRLQGAGRASRFETTASLRQVTALVRSTQPMRRHGASWLVDPAPAEETLRLPGPGSYLLEARTQDPAGRAVVTTQHVSVYGGGDLDGLHRDESSLTLLPDRTSYQPGDTAEILVQNPFPGQALVTVEREKVRRTFFTQLDGPSAVVRVPLEIEDAPNVFVSVLVVRGRADSPRRFKSPSHRLGYCQLKVDNHQTRLRVGLTTDQSEYRPQQYGTVTVTLRDANDQPVPEAEVILYAVDEGIVQLQGDPVPDPYAVFHAPRPLAVRPHLTLPNLFPENPQALRFFNKGYLIGGGGRSRERQDFLPCAFWHGSLRSDAEGRVQVSFTAPDSLTRYRVVAMGQTKDHRFGHAVAAFKVNKPIMIEPALPRYAHVTDQLTARAMVHNRTPLPGEFEVSLVLDATARPAGGGTVTNRLTQRLELPAETSAAVDFPVDLVEAGQARWSWRAVLVSPPATDTPPPASPGRDETEPLEDVVRSDLLVAPVTPLLRQWTGLEIRTGETNLLRDLDPRLLEGEGTVTVQLARSRLLGLGPAIRHLLRYPYGCVEQTSSSLMPWITLHTFPHPRMLDMPQTNTALVVQAGMDRLFSMQTSGGGLSYWPGHGEPSPWGSAYAAYVLTLARQAGFSLPEQGYGQLLNYLREQMGAFVGPDRVSFEACLSLYTLALAGQPQPSYQEILFNQRGKLDRTARALLALAILEGKGSRDMAIQLLEQYPDGRGSDQAAFAGRTAALLLLGWLQVDPHGKQTSDQVHVLTSAQREGHWRTTQDNAWVLHALSRYSALVEDGAESATVYLAGQGKPIPVELKADKAIFEMSFPTVALRGDDSLRLVNPAGHRLFATLDLASHIPQPQAAENRGYTVRRNYGKLDSQNRVGPAENLVVGDRVVVTLEVTAHEPAAYVALDDPLPAVLEAINPAFEESTVPPGTAEGTGIWAWSSDHTELRQDRALFFRDNLPSGTYRVQYVARVRAAGSVTAPPTRVESMYQPDRYGLARAERVHAMSFK